MKKTFAILFASTALTAGIGLPAWSAMHGTAWFEGRDHARAPQEPDARPMRVSDEDGGGERGHEHGLRHSDDDHDEGDDADDDDSRGNAPAAAPAGSVAPPKNGLFGSGSAPKARMN